MPTPRAYRSSSGALTWRVRIRAGGRQTSETFTSESEAMEFCALVNIVGADQAVAHRDRNDRASARHVPTLNDWLPRHVRDLTGVTERTRLDYLATARRYILDDIGRRPLDTLTRSDIAAWLNRLERRGLSAKTIANTHGLLSAALKAAVLAHIIESNPSESMRLPRAREVEMVAPRFLTAGECSALRDALPERERPLFVLLLGTGMRWSEATALRVGDVVDGQPATIHVTKAWKSTPGQSRYIGPPKSLKSRRHVVVAPMVMDALRSLLDQPPDALLLTARRGGPVYPGAWRSRVWVPACAKARLVPPPRVHDLRHTHASMLLSQPGVSLEMVQDQLGHENIQTTRKVYGHLMPEVRNRLAVAAADALERMADPAALPVSRDSHGIAAGRRPVAETDPVHVRD